MNWESEPYRRLVATLPCQNCFAPGPSQASHGNEQIFGKGKGIKASAIFMASLCPTCHAEIDQGKELAREHRRELWMRAFIRTLYEAGERGWIAVGK